MKASNNLNNKIKHLNKQLHNNSSHKTLLNPLKIKRLQIFFLKFHQSNLYNSNKQLFNRRMIFLRHPIQNRMMIFLEILISQHKTQLLQLTCLELYNKLHLTNQLNKIKTISNSMTNFSAIHHLTTIVAIMISCSKTKFNKTNRFSIKYLILMILEDRSKFLTTNSKISRNSSIQQMISLQCHLQVVIFLRCQVLQLQMTKSRTYLICLVIEYNYFL